MAPVTLPARDAGHPSLLTVWNFAAKSVPIDFISLSVNRPHQAGKAYFRYLCRKIVTKANPGKRCSGAAVFYTALKFSVQPSQSRRKGVTFPWTHCKRARGLNGALNRQLVRLRLLSSLGQSANSKPWHAGEVAIEETIYRACLMLLLGLLASMGQDVCRHVISAVWARCGDWTR
jgi:hypothetical protein